jgi:hypothetical protein
MAAEISAACVSSAKWTVSKKRTTAPGMSRLSDCPNTAVRLSARHVADAHTSAVCNVTCLMFFKGYSLAT